MKLCSWVSLFLCAFLFLSCNAQKDICSFEAMNTFMTIQSYGANAAKANKKAKEKVFDIENSISTTRENSYIYQLNNYQKQLQVDDTTFYLVSFAKDFANQTENALNIALFPVITEWGFTTGNYKVPNSSKISNLLQYTDVSKIVISNSNIIELEENMKIDLGALGKGFAGDEIIKKLKENGVTSALLDLGGNIQTLGTKPDGSFWSIGIKNPWGTDDEKIIAGIKIKNQAVITSGGYERFFVENGKKYIHIFDGKSGYPVENEIASVTIICDSGLYGDALSTSMFVMGIENACKFWSSKKDFEMIIITQNKEIFFTPKLENSLSLFYNFTSKNKIE